VRREREKRKREEKERREREKRKKEEKQKREREGYVSLMISSDLFEM
jgi:hypothetical protein